MSVAGSSNDQVDTHNSRRQVTVGSVSLEQKVALCRKWKAFSEISKSAPKQVKLPMCALFAAA